MAGRDGGGDPGGTPRRRIGRRRLVLAAVSVLLLVWLHSLVSPWVSRAGTVVSLAGVGFALLLMAEWLLTTYGPPVWRFARSVARTTGAAIGTDPEVLRWSEAHPRASGWLRERFTLGTWRGLYLTLTLAAVAAGLYGFLAVSEGLATTTGLVRADPQVSALFRSFRADGMTRVMWTATVIGGAPVIVALTLLATALFALWGRLREAVLFAVASASGALAADAIKSIVSRSRPLPDFALIRTPESFAFPSGHAMGSFVFFGLLGLFVARILKRPRSRAAVLTASAVAILLVGTSRVYLGVHWMTDVLGSWSLGLAWVATAFGVLVMLDRYGPPRAAAHPALTHGRRLGLTLAVVMAAAAAVITGAQYDPLLRRVTAAPRPVVLPTVEGETGLPMLAEEDIARLPRVTETLDGSPWQPVGLVLIATRAEMGAAFERSGWNLADEASPATLLRAVAADVASEPYPGAPVTPDFLAGAVQDVAYEKPVGGPGAQRRRLARMWRTRFRANGRPVWVGTTMLARRDGLVSGERVVEPNVDRTRGYVVADLVGGGLELAGYVRVSPSVTRSNEEGDAFFTLGRAAVLVTRGR